MRHSPFGLHTNAVDDAGNSDNDDDDEGVDDHHDKDKPMTNAYDGVRQR